MKTASVWAAEIRRLLAGGVAATALGLVFGAPLSVLALAGGLYLLRQLMHLVRLVRWVGSGGAAPLPVARGPWGAIFEYLQGLRRQNRKRKKRLRKAISRFRQAAEATPDGAVILDAADAIVWSNRAATRLLGLNKRKDYGKPIAGLVRAPVFVEFLAGPRFVEPVEMVSPVNEHLHLLVRIVPYGKGHQLLLVRDVTRLHRLEQTRKDFVANVSHELRSPLTVLVGYLESLEDEAAVPASMRRPIEQMSRQAARMRTLVEDLLELSNLEASPAFAEASEVAVEPLLRRIAEEARRLATSDVAVRVEVDEGLVLLGSYPELYSAFSNLMFNAVQYTGAGGEVDVTARRSEDAGACVEVRDTGEGIEARHIARLTERFYRVDKGRSRELGGTGLGLAIVKHVLVRHDAVLAIESTPGEGSRFTCRFPPERSVRRDALPGIGALQAAG